MINRVNKKLLYLSSFFIPVILYIFIYSRHGICPFGDNTVMTGDMRYQFTDYLSYLKTIIFSNNDFNYSFSKNLGGNLTGFSAYYYFCPLNWITLLFPSSMLPIAEGIILILYAALSSLSFTYMLSKIKGENYLSIPFALAYSMMGFTATYFQLSIYFADLILFPLIVLGLEKIIKNPEDKKFYLITLFAALLSNYYLGYMICIFSTIYYIYRIICLAEKKSDLLKYIKNTKTFIISSILAAALTAFSLLPAVLSLSGEKDTLSISFFRRFEMNTVFAQFFTGSFSGNVSNGLPNIYCGIIIAFFCILYFINSERKLKTRIASLVLIAFFFVNMYINTLNVIWHGFNQPIGFPYRYSFMISFLIIIFAYDEFLEIINKVNIMKIMLTISLILVYGIYIAVIRTTTINLRELLIDFLIIAISSAVIIFFRKNSKFYYVLFATVLILQIADLTYNASDVFNYFDLAKLSDYQTYIAATSEKMDWIKDQDDSFYRIEKDFRRTNNDAMQFDYAGLSHFSSSEKKDKINFMGKLGFRNNGNWAFYNEPTTRFIESFFGIKYFLSEHNQTANKHKRLTDGHADIIIYGNQTAAPIIFASNSSIRDINYNAYNNNPFALQSAIADSITGRNNNIFVKAEPDKIRFENLTEEKKSGYNRYTKINENEDAYIEYDFTVDHESCLYSYFDAPATQNAEIISDGQDRGDYFTTYRWNIVNLYNHEIGDKLTVRLVLKDDTFDLTNSYFYYEIRENTESLFNTISQNKAEIRKINSSELEGEIEILDPEMNSITLTIPYDKGWTVYLDGKKTEIKRAVGILMSIDADIGKHAIRMKYCPPGRKAGIIISLIALIISVLYVKNKKQKYNELSQ
ncbi:MAG: YfhO family protein [Lachnospiraceae bacterium]|nr:YfhO family protein [Lachnospiraceae bacterium]